MNLETETIQASFLELQASICEHLLAVDPKSENQVDEWQRREGGGGLSRSFSKGDVIEIKPVGEKLDPNFHQAMSLIDSDLELNTIVNVIQKGYKIGDRLVRPALVTVSNGKKTSTKED